MQPHSPTLSAVLLPKALLAASSRSPDEAAGVCCSGPQGVAAHTSAQLGFAGAASEQDASEWGLILISTRLEVSLTQMHTEHREPWGPNWTTEPPGLSGHGESLSRELPSGLMVGFQEPPDTRAGHLGAALPPLVGTKQAGPQSPQPGEDSRAGSSRRIRSSVFHQGPLPRHQHPPVMMLREELHGAVGQDHLVRLHLQGSRERESR